MTTTAMFVRRRGRWFFQGITDDPDTIARFVKSVEKDISDTRFAPAKLRTDNFRIIQLPDYSLREEAEQFAKNTSGEHRFPGRV